MGVGQRLFLLDTFLRSFPLMYTMASCPSPVSQVFSSGHNHWTQFEAIWFQVDTISSHPGRQPYLLC